MNTLELLHIIGGKNPDIESFSFHEFPSQSLLQERLEKTWNSKEENHFNNAICLRSKYHLPFWDSVMLCTFDNKDYSLQLLSAALNHNRINDLIYVKKESVNRNTFEKEIMEGKHIACCSLLKMGDGNMRHLPMLDFHIPSTQKNLNVVKNVCRLLDLKKGYIINSGESFHYIASYHVSWEELYAILSKALLFCPIIDRAWISHQLLEHSCSLRVDKKKGIDTLVIDEIE